MATKFSKETYLYWYELMYLIRQFELMAEEKYKMEGKIRGFFHAYVGQEAIAAGCMTATKPDDPFITAYRDHGLALSKGVSANALRNRLYICEPGQTTEVQTACARKILSAISRRWLRFSYSPILAYPMICPR